MEPPSPSTTSKRLAARSELLTLLEERIIALRRSPQWISYLSAQARFHTYSPKNVLLIAMQRPEASHVAGYSTWKQLGRFVNRNERAINILAPILVRDASQETAQLAGFRWVGVFDVTQTSGEPLPTPVTILQSDDPGVLETQLIGVAHSLGFQLRYEALPDGVNGECRWATRTVAIEPGNPPLQRIKTIIHELAHGILHLGERNRPLAEIEAESVAFVVLGACGIDSSPYSAGYVASWIGADRDLSETIQNSCAAIQRAASSILAALEHRGALSTPIDDDALDQTNADTHWSTSSGSNMGRRGIFDAPLSGRTQRT